MQRRHSKAVGLKKNIGLLQVQLSQRHHSLNVQRTIHAQAERNYPLVHIQFDDKSGMEYLVWNDKVGKNGHFLQS